MQRLRIGGGVHAWGGLTALLLTCTALGGAVPALAWRWSNPTPHGNNIKDMAYGSGLGLAIQVTEKGRIYTSSDFVNWTSVASGTNTALRSLAFGHAAGAYSNRVVVVGESGTVLYSDDGITFTPGTINSTTDWLEGVAAGPTAFIAVGDNGAIYTSPNGQTWSKTTVPFSNWMRSIAFGASRFVAVGENGFIASYNGSSWQIQTSSTTQDLNRVYYNNVNFVAVGDGGIVLTNSGAAGWGKVTTGATNDLYAAAGPALGARLVAGVSELRLFDNSSWQSQTTYGAPNWTYLSALQPSRLNNSFVLGGQAGMLISGVRTNSTFSWNQVHSAIRSYFFDLIHADGIYAAVGTRAAIMTSVNGSTWSLELPPASITNNVLLGVGGDTNLLVAAGDNGTLILSTNGVATWISTNSSGTNITLTTNTASTLGVLWTAITNAPTTNTLQGVAAADRTYLVVGDNGTILTTTNGTAWAKPSAPTAKHLTGVAAWTNGFAACGEAGTLLFSSNAANWEAITPITTNWLNRIRWFSGQLVAVGENGTILASTNGRSWHSCTNSSTSWLHDVTKVGDYFFAVGSYGSVLASTNLESWSDIGSITGKELYGAATDGSQLVVAGFEGAILRAQVVAATNPVAIVNFNSVLATNALRNLFIFYGQLNQEFNLESNDDLNPTNWYTDTHLEITDTNGLLYYLQTLPVTNAPTSRFFRTRLSQ